MTRYWLDEVGALQLFVINGTCAVHFALQDNGELKFESFSEPLMAALIVNSGTPASNS